jgi:hypothetical protein
MNNSSKTSSEFKLPLASSEFKLPLASVMALPLKSNLKVELRT